MLDALAIAAPLVLAGERSFFHVPQAAEVRVPADRAHRQ